MKPSTSFRGSGLSRLRLPLVVGSSRLVEQRLRPVLDQLVQLAVQGVEHRRRGSRWRFRARLEIAVRADRRGIQFLLGEREAALQPRQPVLEVRQVLARHKVDGGELLQDLEPFIAHELGLALILVHAQPRLGVHGR